MKVKSKAERKKEAGGKDKTVVSNNSGDKTPKEVGQISKEKKQYRNRVIRAWANRNDVSLDNIKNGRAVSDFVKGGAKANRIKGGEEVIDLKDVERSFEKIVSGKEKVKKGSFYTPKYIVREILNRCFNRVKGRGIESPTVCDPACGSGGFLVESVEMLSKRFDVTPREVVEENIFGIDVDAMAIKHAKALIELYLASEGVTLPVGEIGLYTKDTLLANDEAILDEAGVPEGFDVVVTNPPYVKLQNLEPEYRKKLKSKYSAFVKGSFGLSPLFLVAGMRILSDGGHLGVITQNNLFTSLAGENIREFLQDNRYVDRILDFGHQKVFEGASAYTCLMFLSKKEGGSFEYGFMEDEPGKKSIRSKKYSNIEYKKIESKKWRLAEGVHFDNLYRIERTGSPLIDIAKIKVGFATLNDSVFFVFEDGNRCVSTLDDEGVEVEKEVTREAVKVSELETERDIEESKRRIIFPYENTKSGYELLGEEEMKSEYPKAMSYLESHKEELRQDENDEEWYAWGRSQGMDAVGPKLLTKTFNSEPSFFLDTGNALFSNGYGIWLENSSLFSQSMTIEALKKILNSKIMHYYAKLTSFQIEGNYQCYQKNFIKRFGIPQLNRNEINRIENANPKSVDSFLSEKYGVSMSDVTKIV